MRAIVGRKYEVAHYNILPIDTSVMVSNVMNLLVYGNRRSGFLSKLGPARETTIDKDGKKKTQTMDPLGNLMISVMKPLNEWPSEILAEAAAISGEMKVPIEVEKQLRPLITALTQLPEATMDWGRTLAEFLENNGSGWAMTYVNTPAFGYARKYYYLQNGTSARDWPIFDTFSPEHKDAIVLATALTAVDRGRYNNSLIPQPITSKPDEKDKLVGQLIGAIERARSFAALGILYRLQLPLLRLHANRRLYMACAELAKALWPKAMDVVDPWLEDLEFLLSLPLHDTIRFIAGSLNTGTVSTSAGDGNLLYCSGALKDVAGAPQAFRNMPDMPRAIISAAQKDFFNGGRNLAWGSFPQESIGVGALAAALRGLGDLLPKLGETATKLGWHGSSGDVGQLEWHGAEYTLCDGYGYSKDPTAALLGLTPVLSLGNIKAYGEDRRFKMDFNIGGAAVGDRTGTVLDPKDRPVKYVLRYSAMVVDGYQSATGSGQEVERVILISSQWMGEDGVERVYMDQVEQDPFITAASEHFGKHSASYLIEDYRDPVDVSNNDLYTTDWDPWSTAGSEDQATLALTSGYPGDTQPSQTSKIIRSQRFFHRFPVRMSRSTTILYYDEQGHKARKDLPLEGVIAFDGEIKLGAGPAPLQSIIDAIPVVSTKAVLPEKGPDQIVTTEPKVG